MLVITADNGERSKTLGFCLEISSSAFIFWNMDQHIIRESCRSLHPKARLSVCGLPACLCNGFEWQGPKVQPLLPCWSKQREKTYWRSFEAFLLLLYRVVGNHLNLACRSINTLSKDVFPSNHYSHWICRVAASAFFEFWMLTYADLFYQFLIWSHLWKISQLSSEGENPTVQQNVTSFEVFKSSTPQMFPGCTFDFFYHFPQSVSSDWGSFTTGFLCQPFLVTQTMALLEPIQPIHYSPWMLQCFVQIEI